VGSKVVHGTFWSGFSLAMQFLVQFVRSVVFARLLAPSDFGIIGLAELFTQFVLIFANFGFNSSIIYRKSLDREDLATCWWGNLTVDAAAAVICGAVALASRSFTETPIVGNVMALLSVQYIVVSLGGVSQALMQRLFLFKQSAMIVVVGALVTFGVAFFAIAVFNLGVYGLVIGNIAGSCVTVALRFAVVPWLPSSGGSYARFKDHFRYGRWLLGVHVVGYANGNADRILIAGFLTTAELGYYDYASAIPTLIMMRVGTILSQVLFPVFASLQDNLSELRAVLIRYVRTASVIIYPTLLGLAAVSDDFVRLAYGQRWLPIVLPMQIFCVVGVLRIVTAPLDVLCNSLGRPALPFRASMVLLPINALAVYLAVTSGGVAGAAAVKLLFPVFSLIAVGRPIFKEISLPMRRVLAAVVPGTSASLVMLAVVLTSHRVLWLTVGNAGVRLGLEVGLGVLVYGGTLALFWPGELRLLAELAQRMAGAVGWGLPAVDKADELEIMR